MVFNLYSIFFVFGNEVVDGGQIKTSNILHCQRTQTHFQLLLVPTSDSRRYVCVRRPYPATQMKNALYHLHRLRTCPSFQSFWFGDWDEYCLQPAMIAINQDGFPCEGFSRYLSKLKHQGKKKGVS